MKKNSFLISILLFLSFLITPISFSNTYTLNDLPVLKSEPIHKVVIERVMGFFTQSHFKDITLDYDFSLKIYDRYLKFLDPNHTLLIENDVKNFKSKAPNLVKELLNNDVKTAFELFNFTQKKRFKRYEYAINELNKPFDFTKNDTINIEREELAWPKNELELDKYWQKRVKYDALNLALTDKSDEEIRTTLTKRYQRILRTLTQTKSEDAFQLFMNAFAREIEPHTGYLSPRVKRSFDSEMNLSLEGIGATLTQDEDYTKIVSLVTGGPAEKGNELKPEDKIIGVGQQDGAIEDVIGLRLDDVVDKIRGPKGTSVRLEVISGEDIKKTKIITIVRDKIHFEDQEAKLAIKKTNRGDVGVITIPSFYFGLTDKVSSLLGEATLNKLTGVVIDLRNNGGGSLTEVISLTGLFIEKGPVVQVKDKSQNLSVYNTKNNENYYQNPVVIMINRNSASASEIFAAALQDYGRAIIIGEDSYGKGTVQTSHGIGYQTDKIMHPNWPELGGVQYTIKKFYRINGDSTQLKGVTPDIQMNKIKYDFEFGEKKLKNALPWDFVPPAKYSPYFDMSQITTLLSNLHDERIKNNQEFIYINQDIQSFNDKKETQFIISLNKNIMKKEQENYKKITQMRMLKRLNITETDSKKLEELEKNHKIPDAYCDEAVEVLLDLSAIYLKII